MGDMLDFELDDALGDLGLGELDLGALEFSGLGKAIPKPGYRSSSCIVGKSKEKKNHSL